MENDDCFNCGQEVVSDGYGELVHAETLKYGCAPGNRRASEYPVAS